MAARKTRAKKKPVRVGIAGLGRSGWGIHARLLEPLSDRYQVVAAFDMDADRRAEAEARFGATPHKSFKSLIADKNVELVVVAMPNKLHASCSIEAMKAGKHVVVEKPMATSLSDANKMVATAKRTGKTLTVFQNQRYDPSFLQIRDVIDSGKLGRVAQIKIAYHGFKRRWDWQTLKKNGGGSMNNTGPHPIDQALQLFGDSKPKVFCVRDKTLTLGDADDHFKLILHGKDAPTVEVEVTDACAYGHDTWSVMGTQGGLTGNARELKWKYFNPKSLPKRKVEDGPTPDRSYNRETLKMTEKSWSADKDKRPGAVGFYLDLFDHLRNRKKLAITPESVRRQMQVLDTARKQAPV